MKSFRSQEGWFSPTVVAVYLHPSQCRWLVNTSSRLPGGQSQHLCWGEVRHVLHFTTNSAHSVDILFFRDTTGILVCFKPATWERVKMKLVGLSEGGEAGKYFRYCICVSRFRRPLSSTYGTSYLPTMEGTRTRCKVVFHIEMLLMIVCFKSLEGGVWPEGCKEAKRIQVLSIYLYFKRRCGGSFLFLSAKHTYIS